VESSGIQGISVSMEQHKRTGYASNPSNVSLARVMTIFSEKIKKRVMPFMRCRGKG